MTVAPAAVLCAAIGTALPVGLVVRELRLAPALLAWVLRDGAGILRKTRAGGNWLIGGIVFMLYVCMYVCMYVWLIG